MSTLQKNLTQVRELACEELDLVGGALSGSGEFTFSDTNCGITINANGQIYSIMVTDDKNIDAFID